MDWQKQKIYQIIDTFLVEAKDQNGNERTLTQLNQDRHLTAKAIEHLLEQKDQEFKKILNSGKAMYELGRKEADQEWREKIEKWANGKIKKTGDNQVECESCGLDMYDCICEYYNQGLRDLINFIKQ